MEVSPHHDGFDLFAEYHQYLMDTKSDQTVEAYLRILRQFMDWMEEHPENKGKFFINQLSRSSVESFLAHLNDKGYSTAHQNKVRAGISRFAKWLIEEKQILNQNPALHAHVPAPTLFAPAIPRELTDDQRTVLKHLVDRQQNLRGKAIFALGYWAGCRVCEVSSLHMEDCHLTTKAGWITIGHNDEKRRDIDLLNKVRKPLYDYLHSDERQKKKSAYVFLSQKSEHLTENGIHRWFSSLKKKATKEEWEIIHDITFHDLRQDFTHRAKRAGWKIGEIAYYLGYRAKQGTPIMQTMMGNDEVTREQIRNRLKQIES